MNKQLILGLLAGAACVSAPTHAVVTNGDFSAGLSGWTAQGIVSTSNGAAALFTSITNENTQLYLAPLLSAAGYSGATYGSMLYQFVDLDAGSTLSFDWRFTTSDSLPYDDFAVVMYGGGDLQIADLSSVTEVGSHGDSGWHTFTTTAASPIDHLFFIVSNHTDNGVSSALYIDNVTAVPVPEPGTYALMLAGLGLLAAAARRRQA